MSAVHVNFKANAKASSGKYEEITSSVANAVGTITNPFTSADVEVYVEGTEGGSPVAISFGEAPDALTDANRFFVPPAKHTLICGVGKGAKIAVVDL